MPNTAAELAPKRLLSAKDIAAEFFNGSVTSDWVKRNVAPEGRLRLGHSTLRWFAEDVLRWIEQRRTAA